MRPVTDRREIYPARNSRYLSLMPDGCACFCIIVRVDLLLGRSGNGLCGGRGWIFHFHSGDYPYNFYALLTIAMMVCLVVMKFDFGPMAAHEKNAQNGDLFSSGKKDEKEVEVETANPRGRVVDLVVPILVLIICCIVGMIYTGGFFSGADFVTAFSNSDASVGLALGSFFAMRAHHPFLLRTQSAGLYGLHGMPAERL